MGDCGFVSANCLGVINGGNIEKECFINGDFASGDVGVFCGDGGVFCDFIVC